MLCYRFKHFAASSYYVLVFPSSFSGRVHLYLYLDATSTCCPLGTLRETVRLSLGAKRGSKTRLSRFLRRPGAPKTVPPNLTEYHASQREDG